MKATVRVGLLILASSSVALAQEPRQEAGPAQPSPPKAESEVAVDAQPSTATPPGQASASFESAPAEPPPAAPAGTTSDGPAPPPAAAEGSGAPAVAPVATQGVAETSEVESAPLPKKRGTGFYLHLSGGLSPTWGKTNSGGGQGRVSYEGVSTDLFGSVGYMVVPGLAIHGDLGFLYSLSVDVNQDSGTGTIDSDGTAVRVMSLGGGVTYHFMPIDLFLSAGIGVARGDATEWTFSTDQDGNETGSQRFAATEPGYRLHAGIGKTFFVSPEWALGGGVHYQYAFLIGHRIAV